MLLLTIRILGTYFSYGVQARSMPPRHRANSFPKSGERSGRESIDKIVESLTKAIDGMAVLVDQQREMMKQQQEMMKRQSEFMAAMMGRMPNVQNQQPGIGINVEV